MTVINAFIKKDVSRKSCTLGNGYTGESCSVRLPSNL